MRWSTLIASGIIGISSYAQMTMGKYSDWFGQEITLRPDSSFLYTYHFDLITDRSQGSWTVNGDTLVLRYIDISDVYVVIDSMPILREGTFHRVAYPRYTAAPSLDQKVDTVQGTYAKVCCPGSGRRATHLYHTKGRLYYVAQDHTVLRAKGRDIHGNRVPSYFQRTGEER